MPTRWSRRDLLASLGVIGAGSVGARAIGRAAQGAQPNAAGTALTIAGEPVEIVITPATATTVRVSIVAVGDSLIPSDGALVERTWPAPAARIRSLTSAQAVRSGALSVVVERESPRSAEAAALHMRIVGSDRREAQRLTVDAQTGALTFALGEGPVLGLGEGGRQFDRRGAADAMRSGQGGYQLRTHGGRVPIQWLIGTSGWAIFISHPTGAFDLTGPEGRFETAGARLPLDLFIVAARDPAVVMSEYAAITGHPEMPPRWAFGYQQSHRTLTSRDEILEEAGTFRAKTLPCDTLIYLGTGFCPSGWNTDNGEFAFNAKVFPDPPEMIRQLHDQHFKVVLHAVLEGRTLSGTIDAPCAAAPLPSGRTPDGRWPPDRQASCYWPVHKPVFDLGIDGWWPDQGDGLDAPSRLARIRMYWDGCRAARPDERPFALHRNGHAGMQRYAAFLWSGDVYSTWETLKTHVPVAVNTALSGIPFWGTDIGGFVPTKEFSAELYVRWFQFAAFTPLFRAHGRTWKLRLPWGWNTGDLGPDEVSTSVGAANPDPSELHNEAVEPICRTFLELRSRLMPYLYAAVREAYDSGLPILRALWIHYPSDPAAVGRGDQYLWGRDLLVAPVTERGASMRRVYLPAGRWFDFWTNDTHDGGGEVTRAVDLSVMPLFVRAGAILPLDPIRQYADEPTDEPLTLQIYPGADGRFVLYEDDGRSFGYQRGDAMRVEMQWRNRDRRLTLRLAPGSGMRAPSSRTIRLRVAGTSTSRDVAFTGTPIEARL